MIDKINVYMSPEMGIAHANWRVLYHFHASRSQLFFGITTLTTTDLIGYDLRRKTPAVKYSSRCQKPRHALGCTSSTAPQSLPFPRCSSTPRSAT
jgi:hypothetical protein